MSLFSNSFFSLAGQKERLLNVKDTIVSALTGKVQSNTGNKALDSVLSTAASHPFIVAGGAASIANPAGAAAVVKSVAGATSKAFTASSFTTKAAIVVSTPFVYGAIASNPVGVAKAAATAPSKLASAGYDAGKLIQEPSIQKGYDYVKTHPGISVAGLTAGLIGIGFSSGTIATILNTKAMNQNTNATLGGSGGGSSGSAKTNGHDEDVGKAQAKAAEEVAKQQADAIKAQAEYQYKAQKEANQTALAIAKLQSNALTASTATASTTSSPPVASTPVKKKATRKKAKKKPAKRKSTKKRKTYKSRKRRK